MFTPRSHNCAKLSPSPYKHQYGFCKYGSNRHCFRAFATKLWFTNNKKKKTERCPGLRRVKESAHTVTNIYKFTTVCKIFRIVNKWKNGLYWWNKLNPCDPVCYFFFNFPVYGQVVSSRENCWTIRFHRFVYHINKRIKYMYSTRSALQSFKTSIGGTNPNSHGGRLPPKDLYSQK